MERKCIFRLLGILCLTSMVPESILRLIHFKENKGAMQKLLLYCVTIFVELGLCSTIIVVNL